MYSKFVGAFDANKIAAFMSRAVAGRKSTSKLVGEGPIALDASRDCLASYVKLSAEIAAADAESGGLDEEEEDMLAEIRAEEEAERDALEAELAAQAKAEKAAAELAAAQEKEDAKTEERDALIAAERARRKAKRKRKKKKKKKKKNKKAGKK